MKKLFIVGIMTAFAIGLTSCTSQQAQKEVSANASNIQQKEVVEAQGVVKVRSSKNIVLDFPAYIEKINVKDGQKVKSGDVLLTLNLKDFTAQVENKEKELSIAKLELETTQQGITANQVDIDVLRKDMKKKKDLLANGTDPDIKKLLSDIEDAQNLYEKAQKDLAAKQALFQSNSISRSELDDFAKYVDARKKALGDAKLALESLKQKKQEEIDSLQSQIEQKTARTGGMAANDSIEIQNGEIVMLQHEIEIMKDKLNKSYIKDNSIISDIPNGVVYEIGYKNGDQVNGSQKVLGIMDLNEIYVEANVSEEFIRDVKVGANVTIIPLADKGKKYTGKVLRISSKTFDKNNETVVPVEISIENKDDFLLPDFNMDVEIDKK